MREPTSLAADGSARGPRRLLAAAMVAPALFQLVLYGLAQHLSFDQAETYAQVLVYAASGAAAVAGCVLVARLETARSSPTGCKPVRRD
jgi:radical SAM superfamily enzyme with C-terminal helix-hairpin-helix motif